MAPFESKHRDTLRDILDQQDSLRTRKAEITEAVKALAKELDVKPSVISRLLSLVRKERNNRGALANEQDILDTAIEAAK